MEESNLKRARGHTRECRLQTGRTNHGVIEAQNPDIVTHWPSSIKEEIDSDRFIELAFVPERPPVLPVASYQPHAKGCMEMFQDFTAHLVSSVIFSRKPLAVSSLRPRLLEASSSLAKTVFESSVGNRVACDDNQVRFL